MLCPAATRQSGHCSLLFNYKSFAHNIKGRGPTGSPAVKNLSGGLIDYHKNDRKKHESDGQACGQLT